MDLGRGKVKYLLIEKHIRNLIDKSEIRDGEKLPTIRQLAQLLKVNNVTIVNAYKSLQNKGYAVSKMGSGTYAKKEIQIRILIENILEL